MRSAIDRRTMVIAGMGAVVAVALSGVAVAESAYIHGTISFEGGAPLRKGHIELSLEGPVGSVKTQVDSNGKAKNIAFSLPLPAGSLPLTTQQIVVRLTRKDGWLLARGSARAITGAPVHIDLGKVMY